MANTMEMVRSTLMPMSCAAPLSSEQARMALPILVREVNSVSATITSTAASTVTMVMELMMSWPSKSLTEGKLTAEGNALGSAPQMSSAEFWRK